MSKRCGSTITILGDNGAEAILRCADVEGHLQWHSASARAAVNLPGDRAMPDADDGAVRSLNLSWPG